MFFAIIWLQARCSSVDSIPVRVVLLENNTSCFLDLSNDYGVNFVLQSRHQHSPQDSNNPNQRLHAKTTTWLEFIANDPWHGSLRLAVDGTGAIHGGNGHVAMDQGPLLTVTFDSSQHAFVVSGYPTALSRRHLAYKKYSCHKDNKVTFRIGVVVDPTASALLCDSQSVCEDRVRKLVEDASVPFERNFGIMLRAKEIAFPPANLLPWMQQCGFDSVDRKAKNAYTARLLQSFGAYTVEQQIVDNYAAWVLLTGCLGAREGVAIGYSVCTKPFSLHDGAMFTSSAAVSVTGSDDVSWQEQVQVLAHEFGHIFGADHTFSQDMWGAVLRPEVYKQHSKKGLMDYVAKGEHRIWAGEGDNEVQFHSMHERFVCATINRAMGEEPDTTIFSEDKTARNGMISSSACFDTQTTTPMPTTPGPTTPNPTPVGSTNYWIPLVISSVVLTCVAICISVARFLGKKTEQTPTKAKKTVPRAKMPRNRNRRAQHRTRKRK